MQRTRLASKDLDGHRIPSALLRYRKDSLRTLLDFPAHKIGADFEKVITQCIFFLSKTRTVKIKNRNKRQRLEVIHHELDRQLARNLRRIEMD